MRVREWPAMRIRLHPDVMEWIREDAEKNKRTLNAEVSFCIESHIEAEKEKASGPIAKQTPNAPNN